MLSRSCAGDGEMLSRSCAGNGRGGGQLDLSERFATASDSPFQRLAWALAEVGGDNLVPRSVSALSVEFLTEDSCEPNQSHSRDSLSVQALLFLRQQAVRAVRAKMARAQGKRAAADPPPRALGRRVARPAAVRLRARVGPRRMAARWVSAGRRQWQAPAGPRRWLASARAARLQWPGRRRAAAPALAERRMAELRRRVARGLRAAGNHRA